ncbi:HAMP domain-containing sensor histidine kinase [Methylomonas sp. AM2-LC]|uniref:sensor histidine kinase n=1 Tax=Methylomonas sp. AM2-LC TaxID=3153301 RepID=UPI003263F0BC
MKLKNLFSLKSLLIFGLSVALTPFFIGFLYATFAIRDMSMLGRSMNAEIFEQTKAIGVVLLKASDIERKARLFVLLSDPAVQEPYERQSYENARIAFKNALNQLLKLSVDNKIALLGNELLAKEDIIYQQISNTEAENLMRLPIDEAFQGFRETANNLSHEIETSVDLKFKGFSANAEDLEHTHFYAGILLFLLSLVFIIVLLSIVTRAIWQLNMAVRRLSARDLVEPINIVGPSDLSYLGTQLEYLRQQFVELENSKQNFIYNFANEIHVPIDTIHGCAEFLICEATANMNRSAQKVAENLLAEIKILETLYKQLLRYSQLNTQTDAQIKEITNVDAVLESVVDAFQTDLQQKSIILHKFIEPVQLFCIQSELHTIFEQLLANAIKFSPQNGEIRMVLHSNAEQMEFEIEDEGPGIAPAQHLAVFEPFFRSQTLVGTDNKHVPGVGLAIVRQYIIKHQGTVEIIDSSPDQLGTRVLVKIPLGANS